MDKLLRGDGLRIVLPSASLSIFNVKTYVMSVRLVVEFKEQLNFRGILLSQLLHSIIN